MPPQSEKEGERESRGMDRDHGYVCLDTMPACRSSCGCVVGGWRLADGGWDGLARSRGFFFLFQMSPRWTIHRPRILYPSMILESAGIMGCLSAWAGGHACTCTHTPNQRRSNSTTTTVLDMILCCSCCPALAPYPVSQRRTVFSSRRTHLRFTSPNAGAPSECYVCVSCSQGHPVHNCKAGWTGDCLS
jgi:hypothetical protein